MIVILAWLAQVNHAFAFTAPIITDLNSQLGDTSRDSCNAPANPIVLENCQPGTTDWHITKLDNTIEGFASATSVSAGESLDFFVNTTAAKFDVSIFRSGYYSGMGGRLIQTINGIAGRVQPECNHDATTGLVSCSNWSSSYRLTIPADWVSGVYIVKLTRPDTKSENYILFIVRDDTRHSAILAQVSYSTFQAYNNYGGKSLYSFNSDNCATISNALRAVAVSFDRPMIFPTLYFENSYFWGDYPMVAWLEAQGYDVSYNTSMDTLRSGKPGVQNELLNHRVFLSIGHDEYWSQEMHDAISAARDAGVHLGFFSSNVSYWRVRFASDPWTGKPDRTMISYKSTESGGADPSGWATSTWRDPAGVNNPENSLIGQQYIGDNDNDFFPLRVSADMAKDSFYRHTGLDQLPPGGYVDIGQRLIGWEWDAVVDNGLTPKNLTVLAASPVYGVTLADAGRKYITGKAIANVTRYIAPSGAIVFAAGTNLWAWGLAVVEPDRRIQQMTYNLLTDMGVHPATPAQTLVLESVKVGRITPTEQVPLISQPDPFSVRAIQQGFTMVGVQDAATVNGWTRTSAAKSSAASSLFFPAIRATTTAGGATITWQTNVPATGKIWVSIASGGMDYGAAQKGVWRSPEVYDALFKSLSTQHEFTMSGLTPDTIYYFQVAGTDAHGETSFSPENSFQTARGSWLDQIKVPLKPTYTEARCWVSANKSSTQVVAVVIGLTLVGFFSWIILFFRRTSRR